MKFKTGTRTVNIKNNSESDRKLVLNMNMNN